MPWKRKFYWKGIGFYAPEPGVGGDIIRLGVKKAEAKRVARLLGIDPEKITFFLSKPRSNDLFVVFDETK